MSVDPILQARRGWVIGVCAAIPVLACWLLTLIRGSVTSTTAALGMVLLIVAAAATGIRVAGIVAALTAALAFDYFLAPPFFTFTIADPDNLEAAVLLLLVGAAVSEIANWGRRQQARASRQQGYLDGLLGTADAVAAGRSSTGELIDLVGTQIVTLLGIDGCRFESATHYGLPTLTEDGTLTRGGRTVDVARKGLPTDTTVALPARSGSVVHGYFLLTASARVARPSRQQLGVAVMLADQVGVALADAARREDSAPPTRRDDSGP